MIFLLKQKCKKNSDFCLENLRNLTKMCPKFVQNVSENNLQTCPKLIIVKTFHLKTFVPKYDTVEILRFIVTYALTTLLVTILYFYHPLKKYLYLFLPKTLSLRLFMLFYRNFWFKWYQIS